MTRPQQHRPPAAFSGTRVIAVDESDGPEAGFAGTQLGRALAQLIAGDQVFSTDKPGAARDQEPRTARVGGYARWCLGRPYTALGRPCTADNPGMLIRRRWTYPATDGRRGSIVRRVTARRHSSLGRATRGVGCASEFAPGARSIPSLPRPPNRGLGQRGFASGRSRAGPATPPGSRIPARQSVTWVDRCVAKAILRYKSVSQLDHPV
jgi:hypothetical protein